MAGFQPAALLFDMDGLLLDTERAARDSFLEVAASFGVTASEAEPFFLTLVGTSTATTRARVAEFIPDADLGAVETAWSDAMNRRLADHVPVKPTVRETLHRLHEAGHGMAVVTSTYGNRARHHLEQAGLLPLFAHVTGGDEVSANKPDPAPYLETAARLGVPATSCAAFEDSDRGLKAAVSAGCRTVQIPDLRPQDVPLPDLGQEVAEDLASAMVALGLFD